MKSLPEERNCGPESGDSGTVSGNCCLKAEKWIRKAEMADPKAGMESVGSDLKIGLEGGNDKPKDGRRRRTRKWQT